MKRCYIVVFVLHLAILHDPASAQSFKPDDVYPQLRDAITSKLQGARPVPGNWLSITAVGAVAEADDPNAINELANFCPDPSPEIDRFGGIRPLDLVYEQAITWMVGPLFTETPALQAARKYLRGSSGTGKSSEYTEYLKYQADDVKLLKQFLVEKDEDKRNALSIDIRNLEHDWKVQGFKGEVEAALFQIDNAEGIFGPDHNFHRAEVLSAFRSNGITKNWQIGSFSSPASEVSPPVADWDKDNGWFGVSSSTSQSRSGSGSSSGSSSGGGFLHIGGLIGGVSSGGGDDRSWSVSDVKTFGYSFEVKRIKIIRKWLDPRVFSTVGGWAWVKKDSTKDYPLISGGYTGDGKILTPAFIVYDSQPVDCPMIPSELIIARKLSATLTTSSSDYNEVKSAGSSGGGGFFGGLFGGNTKRSWNTTEISRNGNDVTYKIEAPGTAVIGLISQLSGKLPNPDPKRKWPDEAWLEDGAK